jgi:hypothetical protein
MKRVFGILALIWGSFSAQSAGMPSWTAWEPHETVAWTRRCFTFAQEILCKPWTRRGRALTLRNHFFTFIPPPQKRGAYSLGFLPTFSLCLTPQRNGIQLPRTFITFSFHLRLHFCTICWHANVLYALMNLFLNVFTREVVLQSLDSRTTPNGTNHS